MATKKPKTSAKPTKAKTTKPKTAAKTTVKPVSEAPKTKTVEKEAKAEKKSCFKSFFAKKYEGKESITIHIQTVNSKENVAKIIEVIHEFCEEVRNIEFVKDGINKDITIAATVQLARGVNFEFFSTSLIELEEVLRVE